MRCIICGGTSFSIRVCDIDKPREEQIKYSKYGDCCSLSCAFKKSQRLITYNGYTKKIYRVSPTKTYVVQIPNSKDLKGPALEGRDLSVPNATESDSQTEQIAEAV